MGGTNISFNLTITTKPRLVITEVMASEAKGAKGAPLATEDWWELSNLGTFPVNLQGYRFDDDHDSFADAQTIATNATIAPGESIILVETMSPGDFRTWWGTTNLPVSLQIITYPAIGFSSDGDSLYLWNAAASSVTDVVASVTFSTATKGVSFGYDPVAGIFAGLSASGQSGAFTAAVNGDIGSPGSIITLPRFTNVTYNNANGFKLNFVTQSNVNYALQYKQALTATNWTTLTNFVARSSLFQVNDPTARTNPAGFYRVVATP
jgi:hypothetical protein